MMENLPIVLKVLGSLLSFVIYLTGFCCHVENSTIELDHETLETYNRETTASDYRHALFWPLFILYELSMGIYECLKEVGRVIRIIIRGDN